MINIAAAERLVRFFARPGLLVIGAVVGLFLIHVGFVQEGEPLAMVLNSIRNSLQWPLLGMLAWGVLWTLWNACKRSVGSAAIWLVDAILAEESFSIDRDAMGHTAFAKCVARRKRGTTEADAKKPAQGGLTVVQCGCIEWSTPVIQPISKIILTDLISYERAHDLNGIIFRGCKFLAV